MRVSRLEIFGFKSFVERLVLNFDQNILGIVGPNGCGKSNVVDALRWVLGETHARQLRGGSFEDLIFNGSDSRRPMGMAEVTLTIRPHEGMSYSSNDAVGVIDPLTLIPSDSENSEKSEGIEIEEGVVKSEQGELLNSVPSSIMDFPGILECSEIELTRRLYRSGESEYFINRTPCRLRDMIDLYRLIGLGARGLSIVQQGQIGQLISKKPIERRELLEEAAGIAGFRSRMEAAERKLERTKENMFRLKDIIVEVEKQVRSLKRQATRALARKELKEALSALEEELYLVKWVLISAREQAARAESNEFSNMRSAIEAKLMRLDASITEIQALIHENDSKLIAARQKRDQTIVELSGRRERRQSIRLAYAQAEAKISGINSQRERINSEIVELQDEKKQRQVFCLEEQEKLNEYRAKQIQVETELEAYKAQIVEANSQNNAEGEYLQIDARLQEISKLSALKKEQLESLPIINREIDSINLVLRDLRKELQTGREEKHKNELCLARYKTEIEFLNRQLAVPSEMQNLFGVKGFEQEGEQLRSLVSVMTVEEPVRKALTAILGERASFVVTDDSERMLNRYGEWRKDHLDSLVQIGIVNKSNKLANQVVDVPEEVSREFKKIIDEIEILPEYKETVCKLLGKVFLTENLDQAIKVSGQLAGFSTDWAVVSRSGEVVTAWGWYVSGKSDIRLSFKKRIEELESSMKEVELAETNLQEQADNIARQINESEIALESLLKNREKLIQTERELSVLAQEERVLEKKKDEEALRRERIAREAALNAEREIQARIREVIQSIAAIESSLNFENKRIAAIESKITESNVKFIELNTQEQECIGEYNSLSGQIKLLELEDDSALEIEAKRLEDEINSIQSIRDNHSLSLSEKMNETSALRRELSGVSEAAQRTLLELERIDVERQMLMDDFRRWHPEKELDLSDTALEPVVKKLNLELNARRDELENEVSKLRARLEREGEVDPQAIEQHETERQRLDNLQSQLADLEVAYETLDRGIRQLKEVCKTRFIETFKIVNAHFVELVPRLFGGGAGHLTLVNPDDPLASGVEISVRPPGKRLTTMELLSGGEKALVATAVLISMFLHRPSPICVLDEVDAPLDEANLERFLGLIREISVGTQFLIITHNKTTMQAVDRLVGITMQEKGVSTAVSVSLNELEEEIMNLEAVNA